MERELIVRNIYNVDNRLESALRRLRNDASVSPRNKELILKFHEHVKASGCGKPRQIIYLIRLGITARFAHKSFDEMNKDDIIKMVNAVYEHSYKGRPLSERSKVDYGVVIKRFFKWLYSNSKKA